MNNQEIVRKLIDSKVVNFDVLGKFIAENGAAIATSEGTDFSFRLYNHFIIGCIPPYMQLRSFEELSSLINVKREALEEK